LLFTRAQGKVPIPARFRAEDMSIMQRQQLSLSPRLLSSVAAVCCLCMVAGCNLLNLMPAHLDNPNVGKLDPGRAGSPLDPASLPIKFQSRVSQYLFLSDFEIRRDLPLFRELSDMRDQIHKTLQLPPSTKLVQVYLFEDSERYERFMQATHPELPKRRAFFIAQPRPMGEELLVFTYWGNGDRIQQDLRHELTHALLNSALRSVPLWLDEGLAEYFEIAPGKGGVSAEHIKQLRHGPNGPLHVDLNRLEQLKDVTEMTPAEYREAWAWVHFMLHGHSDAKNVLIGYLRDLRTSRTPGSLRSRLTQFLPSPEAALDRHLQTLEQNKRVAAASQ
jgi:hypothetical protein